MGNETPQEDNKVGNETSQEDNKMEKVDSFRSLTANKDTTINKVTLDALEFALKEPGVTNVAITGNYGAGKSSIVESFEKESENKEFIHISLGQYDETISSEKNGLNNRQINTIEGKIINQLLHQINPNQIRKSIFKTLDAESQIKPFNISVYVSLVLLLSLYLLNISSWNGLIQNFSWLSWTTKPIISLLVLVILFVLIVYGFYFLLKLQKDFGFIKKLSLKAEKIETDIEIFSNDNSKVSYFDRYLDDVLYLFKQSGADVIVFEDIERFNDSRIFEKLKELNVIINRKRKTCDDSKLVFFYLVKDDLFESQERTKFFDFIIPIVPVVTTSNSHIKLIEILKGMGEDESFEEIFLLNIALYLDDMRLITNICNEYLIYKETLDFEIDPYKLFSLIVYKNLFPKDFSLLQKNKGNLFKKLNPQVEYPFTSNEETKIEQQNDIATFLINNKYIDENYRNYLSYFYGDGLLEDEKNFIKNVNSSIVNSPTVKLTNYNEIIKRIALDNYKYEYVLNFGLFEFLLNPTSGGPYDQQLNYIFNQKDVLNFFTEFYKTLDRVDKLKRVVFKEDIIETFLRKWLEHNSQLFITYINNKTYQVTPSIILSLLSLVDLEETDYKNSAREYHGLRTIDKNNIVEDALSIYLQEHQELFCQKEYRNIDIVKKNLKWLNIRFKGFLSAKDSYNREIIDFIYNNQLYGIQKETIEFFTRFYLGDIINDSEFKHKNFEMIHEHSELYPIRDYCLSYRNEFLDYVWMYIKLSENKMLDKPKYIEKLLNENIVFENKGMKISFEPFKDTAAENIISSIPENYITYTREKFNKLKIENQKELVKNLVQTKKAEVNTEIVLEYFRQNNEGDANLVDFINQSTNFRLDNNIYQNLEEEIDEKFQKFIIKSLGLKKNIRTQLLRDIGIPYYEIFDDNSLDNYQLQDLMYQHLIDFNKVNIDFIKEEYPELIGFFILYNINDYVNFRKEQIDLEVLESLYEQNEFEEKIELKILSLLLDDHYNEDYFIYLIDNYTFDESDKQLQEDIQKIVKKYIKQFIELDEEGISYSLYESILNSNDVLTEHKKKLFEKLISVSENRIKIDKLALLGDYLDLLELPNIMQILKEQINDNIYTEWKTAFEKLNQNEGNGGQGNQDTKVPYSEFNEKLLNYLKKRELISDKSRYEDSVLKLYGFRTKQIEFKDSLGENDE